MSPRAYGLGVRRESSERTRARIIAAARKLIMAGPGRGFSLDAVAREAGVARMTVYYQFGSKRGLLEALFDDLAARDLASRLPNAFSATDPLEALARLIDVFIDFWASERAVIRRIRGIAALDPEFEEALKARDERRREGLRQILRRLDEVRPDAALSETVDALHMLSSFETFDALATHDRGVEDVRRLVQRLARTVLGLDAA